MILPIIPLTSDTPRLHQHVSCSPMAPRKRTFHQGRANPRGAATSRTRFATPLDTHDLRRGLRATNPKRNLTCISRLRHARSPQRVAPDKSKTQSHLHFAPSTRAISAEGCARQIQNAISPAFRALDTHDLRRGLRFVVLRRHRPRP